MSMSDPISSMLTHIRNGLRSQKLSVWIPHSKVKVAILKILKKEGYIKDFSVSTQGEIKHIEIKLKYFRGTPVIEEIVRVSRPSCRIYKNFEKLPFIKDGLGVALVSTSKGIMTDKVARQHRVGGEIICTVF